MKQHEVEPNEVAKEVMQAHKKASEVGYNWAIALAEALKPILAAEGVDMNAPSARFSQVIGMSRHTYYQLTRGKPLGSFQKMLFYSILFGFKITTDE